jgi:hypothetical protein
MGFSGDEPIPPQRGLWNDARMIPPKKFTSIDPAKQETAVLRPSNLQRMKDRLESIKGVPKLAYVRKVEGAV